MESDSVKAVPLYGASATFLLICLYLVNLAVYVEWSASFPNRPAEEMRQWAYLYYFGALASLSGSVLLFRAAWKRRRLRTGA